MNKDNINPVVYFFIVLLAGPFGLHKFIDDDFKTGILYFFTCGLFGIGWFFDIIMAFLLMLEYLVDKPSKSDETDNIYLETNINTYNNRNTYNKPKTYTTNNPMVYDDGNMYTKLRGVTKDCVLVMGLSRQQALDKIDENTPVHFEFSNDKNKTLLVVTDDTGIDLGEFIEERKNYLIEHYDDVLSIKPKIKNITGGYSMGYYGCNIVIDSLPDREHIIINNIVKHTESKYLSDVNYENSNKELIKLIPYNLEYNSLSGGYTNYSLYCIETKADDTVNSYTVKAKDEASAIKQVKKLSDNSNIEIIKTELMKLEPATNEQINTAKDLGYAIPDDACFDDAQCIIDRAQRKDYNSNVKLAMAFDKLGCNFSRFSTESQLINQIIHFEDNRTVASFYYYVYLRNKKKLPLGNFYTFSDKRICNNYGLSVCEDERIMTSIRKALAAAPDISKGTVAYKSANNFYK